MSFAHSVSLPKHALIHVFGQSMQPIYAALLPQQANCCLPSAVFSESMDFQTAHGMGSSMHCSHAILFMPVFLHFQRSDDLLQTTV